MSGVVEEIHHLLDEARTLDHGPAQIAILERATALADGGQHEDLMLRTRLRLTNAYEHGGQPAKALGTISWQLNRLKTAPESFDQDARHSALWHLKYPFSTMVRFPQVALARTEELLDEVESLYRFYGKSQRPVHGCRHRVAKHVGDLAEAERQYQLWLGSPRDELADCSGCDPELQMTWLIDQTRDEEAIHRAEDVLSGRISCSEQPQSIMTTLLPAYVRTGRLEQAAESHLRSYRLLRRKADRSQLAGHLTFCARTGNDARGLELVELMLPTLDTAPSPYDRMMLAAGSALVLRRITESGAGDTEVRTPSGPITAGGLQPQLAEQAAAIAAEFDTRNGNTFQSTRVQELLTAEPWVAVLPLQLGQPTRPRAVPRRAPATAPVRSLAELTELVQHSDRLDADDSRLALSQLAGHLDDPAATAEQAGWAAMAAAWIAGRDRNSARVAAAAERAIDAFDRAGQPHWKLIAEATVITERLDLTDETTVANTLSALEQTLSSGAAMWGEAAMSGEASLDDRTRVELAEVRARLCYRSGRAEDASAVLTEALPRVTDPSLIRRLRRMQALARDDLADSVDELTALRQEYLAEGLPGRAAGLADALAIGLRARGVDPQQVIDLVTESLPVAPHDVVGTLHHLRGDAYQALGQPAEAVGDLSEAVAVLTADGAIQSAGFAGQALGDALLKVGRALEAAEVLETGLPAFADTDPVQAAYLRKLLVRALVRLPELDAAEDEVERILADTTAAEAWGDQAEIALELGNLLQTRRPLVAIRLFRAAMESCDRVHNPLWAARAHRRLGVTQLMVDRDEALQTLTVARERIDALPESEHYSVANEQADWNYQVGWGHWNIAADDDAQGYLLAAEAGYAELGDDYWTARSMVLRGESLADLDRPTEALPVLTAARDRFGELGADWDRDRADQLIERCREALAG